MTDKRDDNNYTATKINGNVWMTQNLRFAGSHIEPELTNIDVEKDIAWTDLTLGNSYDAARYHNSGNTTNGYWYNYAGASAMTITGSSNSTNATYDICPAGWKLPSLAEFQGIASDSTAKSAFSITGGFYDNGYILSMSNGYWWSSVASNNNRWYYLYYSSNLGTGDGVTRDGGFYVRCIRSN